MLYFHIYRKLIGLLLFKYLVWFNLVVVAHIGGFWPADPALLEYSKSGPLV